MSFPTEVLDGISSAVCFFSAAFLGANVKQHIAEAGISALCIDKSGAKLAEMWALWT